MKHFDTEQQMSQAFATHHAFFAFNKKQFEEHKIEGVEYVSLGQGLISPVDTAIDLIDTLNSIHDQRIKYETENNTHHDLIWYELGNHECQISRDITPVVELMKDYGIEEEEVKREYKEYFKYCVENDIF